MLNLGVDKVKYNAVFLNGQNDKRFSIKAFIKNTFLEDSLSEKNRYRHEFKYLINDYQYHIIKNNLDCIMELDPHVQSRGYYSIRSLYFDDYEDSCFFDNENGVDPRQKFRIRIYNASSERISLESKIKIKNKTLKQSCSINKQTVERLIMGKKIEWDSKMHPLLKKVYYLQETRLLSPKVIVEYDRIPYVERNGNVRITLDLDVRCSGDIITFFDKTILDRPVMPIGYQLLEVKYDSFIPDYIHRSIYTRELSQTTFSKYYYCKKFGGIL